MKVGLVQLNSTENKRANLQVIYDHFQKGLSEQVSWFCLPEVCSFRSPFSSTYVQAAESLDGETIQGFCEFSRKHSVSILVGSFVESLPKIGKVSNSSVLIYNGDILAVYRKLHLFDVDVDDVLMRESAVFQRGDDPVLSSVGEFNVGLSVCYDIRFPELYRYYSSNGAHVLTVPASFTSSTGKAHWHVLCRARAIENQCYVVAPNQYGVGANGVDTYGHSLVVDPWGTIIAEGSAHHTELLVAELEFSKLENLREKMPVLTHRRLKGESL